MRSNPLLVPRPLVLRWSGNEPMHLLWRTLHRLRAPGWRGCRLLSSGRSGMDIIYDKMKATGPVTVAEYMRECLLHPVFGYYMQKDVFGEKGDFTTSPEISQVFGELVAVWVLADWMASGEPTGCQLVELGPGRGTLAKDMLRVFGQFKSILNGLSVHCVEASPALSAIQQHTLTGLVTGNACVEASPALSAIQQHTLTGTRVELPTATDPVSSCVPYKSCTLDSGVHVSWYRHLEDVPKGRSYIVAQEFLDAFPVHQFQRTEAGWREVLVDIDPENEEEKALRFVLAPGPTPASTTYGNLLPHTTKEGPGQMSQAEICPEGLVLVKEIAARVKQDGGGALIADYGEEGVRKHTLRGFKQHQLHDPLVEPGSADLTADVDFRAIKMAATSEGAGCFGPITQNEFLHKMGIRQRIDVLLGNASPSAARDLLSSYEMLTHPGKMGERFKFLSITSSPDHIPTPF